MSIERRTKPPPVIDEAEFCWGECRKCGDLFLLFTDGELRQRAALCKGCQTPVILDDEPEWLVAKGKGHWTP